LWVGAERLLRVRGRREGTLQQLASSQTCRGQAREEEMSKWNDDPRAIRAEFTGPDALIY
jgi:hypothetical protein